MNKSFLFAAVAASLTLVSVAQGAEPKVKVLTPAEDATQKTVLIGRALVNNMTIVFEIEPAKAMWMPMGKSGQWMEHAPRPNERFHVEVKPVDPASNTRIPYANVQFAATNKDNGKKVQAQLHPMWGGSGLHYTVNSALAARFGRRHPAGPLGRAGRRRRLRGPHYRGRADVCPRHEEQGAVVQTHYGKLSLQAGGRQADRSHRTRRGNAGQEISTCSLPGLLKCLTR